MDALDIIGMPFVLDDDLLNFNLDGEGEEEKNPQTIFGNSDSFSSSSSLESSNSTKIANPETQSGLIHEYLEVEPEWLSNKDAFPPVESCFGIFLDDPELLLNHHSPVSVLENGSNDTGITVVSRCSSLKVARNHPVGARSKIRRRKRVAFGDLPSQQWLLQNQVNVKKSRQEVPLALPPVPLTMTKNSGASMGRRCLHCQADKTPQWRAGPMGPKTLCNACGVRYKSGRLLPEYRPASSPTFSSILHSNSHRKVIEMRRQKLLPTGVICSQ